MCQGYSTSCLLYGSSLCKADLLAEPFLCVSLVHVAAAIEIRDVLCELAHSSTAHLLLLLCKLFYSHIVSLFSQQFSFKIFLALSLSHIILKLVIPT